MSTTDLDQQLYVLSDSTEDRDTETPDAFLGKVFLMRASVIDRIATAVDSRP